MKPLLVTAHLSSGFSAADRWSPALDGILAYHHLRLKMGVNAFNQSTAMNEQSTVDDLPLKKIEHAGQWWWACSSPEFSSQGQLVRSFYKKFNIDHSMMIKQKGKSIELTKGQFKNYSLNFKEIAANHIQWHVIGDKAAIERLLNECNQIGANRGKGMGLVEQWVVSNAGDTEKAMFSRPVPIAAAEHFKIEGVKAWRGFKPSVRLKENQGVCVLPK